ncbi:hypothetical protein [Amycolatopsis anabasis]|uniref:hypothetical protein n=1 Tax=Amycolatopsis anabasis TaxID=1840409 RepID=UPI00131A76C4|nr:hypothetical protein [Amycolatopsis anabasis]
MGRLVTYVVIEVEGRLRVREVDKGLEEHEWGVLQAGLSAAVEADVDPRHRRSNGIALPGGLWVRMADGITAEPQPDPRNAVATVMLALLGDWRRRTCFGTSPSSAPKTRTLV